MIRKNSDPGLLWFFLPLALGICAAGPIHGQGTSSRLRPRLVVASNGLRETSSSRTVGELQSTIQAVLRRPELASAFFAVKVASLDTGQVLFEQNGAKLLRPASNLKLYTWAAALDKLSPEFRFQTSVYAAARPDSSGTVHGNLTIYGRGDPSISSRFSNGDYGKAIDTLASKIAGAGVKTIDGDLVGDETYFTGPRFAPGWEWDDLQWWYGAEVSALTINDNSVDLFVKPGPYVGAPCAASLGPPTSLVTIINHTTTTKAASANAITVYRDIGQNVIEIGGSMGIDNEGYSGSVAISHPAEMFVSMLQSSLARMGISITGRARAIERIDPTGVANQKEPRVEIASIQSPPLGIIAAHTLKASQNLYSELVLRTIGKASRSGAARTDDEEGISVVKTFLRQAGIDGASLTIGDGSGLSRNDLVTANSIVQLLAFMSRHRFATAFRDALPVAGVDGTLKNRMKRTPAAGNVRAKTGTLASAMSLSGYVTSERGEKLVFSIIVNNFPEDNEREIRRNVVDAIAILLASFSGHS